MSIDLDDFDEALDDVAKERLKRAKKVGIKAVRQLVYNRMYKNMGYKLLKVSNDIVNRIMKNEFNTIEEVENAAFEREVWTAEVLYRTTEDNLGVIAIIEAFFFKLNAE